MSTPQRMPLYHVGEGDRLRMWHPDALVQPTNLFTGTGLYVVRLNGERITMRLAIPRRGKNSGKLSLRHIDPDRVVLRYRDPYEACGVILGRVVDIGRAVA